MMADFGFATTLQYWLSLLNRTYLGLPFSFHLIFQSKYHISHICTVQLSAAEGELVASLSPFII